MTPNDIVQPPSGPITDNRLIMPDETKKLSFWISQIFILAATVMGVYLASSQGFKQALAYGDIQAARNNYYLRKSLQSELADNIPLVREYMTKVEKGNLADRKTPFALDTFVWESMKNSSSTLETPPELLRESRKFYRGIAELQQKIADSTYSGKVGAQKLGELTDNLEQNVLPKFTADLDTLRKWLRERGVEVS